LKQKLLGEMAVYLVNAGYLFLFLGVFTTYRRLILAQYQIDYLNYGVSLVEAMVLAKIIMVGDVLRLARGLENKPLILPTLYKAVVFSFLVGVFAILEKLVTGWIKGTEQGLGETIGKNKYEFVAKCLVTLFAFIPFFAIRELARTLGKGKVKALFFSQPKTG